MALSSLRSDESCGRGFIHLSRAGSAPSVNGAAEIALSCVRSGVHRAVRGRITPLRTHETAVA